MLGDDDYREKEMEILGSINDENCSCGGTLGKSRNNDNYQKSSEAKYIQTEILENEINNVNSLSIKLYPNPGKDVVNLVVEGEISNGFEYKVFSTTGVLIEENHVGSNVTQLYLKKGMYIVNVNYNGIWHSKKLIIH